MRPIEANISAFKIPEIGSSPIRMAQKAYVKAQSLLNEDGIYYETCSVKVTISEAARTMYKNMESGNGEE